MKETLGVVKNPVASRAAENRAAARKAVAVVGRKAVAHKVEAVAVPAVAIGKLTIVRASFCSPYDLVRRSCRLAKKFVKRVETVAPRLPCRET